MMRGFWERVVGREVPVTRVEMESILSPGELPRPMLSVLLMSPTSRKTGCGLQEAQCLESSAWKSSVQS
jgi:hypothetical protein